jgi:uncharacterized protein (DUF433 family)
MMMAQTRSMPLAIRPATAAMMQHPLQGSVVQMDEQLERISIDPLVMVGKPVIPGTRIPVELVVRMLAQGIPENDILEEYPRLELIVLL